MGRRAVIGIDIGGTKTLCALITDKFEVVESAKFKTAPAAGKTKFTQELQTAVSGLVKKGKRGGNEVIGIGIACAGRVDCESCSVAESPNVLWLENYQIGRVLKRAVHLESVIGNDVQMALYGEHQLGVAKGCENVLGVFFGTGVGGAAVVNGKLYHGASGHGGQVGATLAHSLGGAETLESHGMLDRLASKAAIAGAAFLRSNRRPTRAFAGS